MASRSLVDALPPMSSSSAFQGMDLMGGASMDTMAMNDALPMPTMPQESVIDRLKPDSDLHRDTLQRLDRTFKYSADKMKLFHPRWNYNEQRIQAFVAQPDYEQLMKELENNRGTVPEPVKVIVPYSYATMHAAASFWSSVLLGRRPIFPIMAVRGTTTDKARHIEMAIQSNLEASKAYEVLWQFLWDGGVYSFGSGRTSWTEEWGKSLRIVGGQREVTDGLRYAGNKVSIIDPYAFFPDPRVPIHQVSERGDFCFWVTPQSKLRLKDMEKDGLLKWVDCACETAGTNLGPGELGPVSDSKRRARIGLDGTWDREVTSVVGFRLVREGTIRLVPKDWKLGDSDRSELWKFAWTAGKQIIQAEPFSHAHQKHPVFTAEPASLGHDFGSLAMADFIGVFQDIISWLVNSRMENVRTTINNQFLVDPGRIEMQDLRTPAPGRAIRLKRAAIGADVREAFMQLQVMDTTQGHFNDMQMLRLLADTITGVNDNLRGIQTQGGRRSATEARQAMQAGASRLSQQAIRISSQGFTELASQMIFNIQQFMPEEMWTQVTGDDGSPMTSLLTPDMIVGDFNYQVSDGSLPYDKQALLEVWKELMFGIAQDPELRQSKDLNKIFEYVAQLGGAKNITAFNRQQPQQQQLPAPGQTPQGAMPIGPALPAPPARLSLPAR